MRRLKKYILLLLLFIVQTLHAQLNEFIIMWYFTEHETPLSYEPWSSDALYADFLKKSKENFNFNTVFFERHEVYDSYINNPSYKIFDYAKLAGLKSILRTKPLDAMRNSIALPSNFNKNEASAKLDYYSSDINVNDNIIGYNLVDEPSVSDTNYNWIKVNGIVTGHYPNTIDLIPDYANVIREHNPKLLRWVNLCNIFDNFQTDYYYRNHYLQEYINTSNPNILSFDQYPFERNSENLQLHYYRTLYNMAIKSVENAIPFFFVTTTFNNLDTEFFIDKETDPDDLAFRNKVFDSKNVSKFNYSIYSALIYGAKGIAYWPGFEWVVDNSFGHSYQLNFENSTQSCLKELHGKLLARSNELLSLNFASVYHKSFTSTIGSKSPEQIHDFCSWNNLGDDKYAQQVFEYPSTPYDIITGYDASYYDPLVVSFLTDSQGKIYFWLFNKSLTNSLNFYLVGKASAVGFRDILNDVTYQTTRPYIELAPGEAKLLTPSTTSSPINYSITNYPFNGTAPTGEDHLYPFESANQIILGQQGYNSTEPAVKFESNATKSFMANQIVINPGVAIYQGSSVRLSAYKDCNTITSSPSGAPRKKDDATEQAPLAEPKVYPNPTRDNFIVKTSLKENEEIEVRVYDNVGRIINVTKALSEETTISLGNQPAGIYFVHFSQNDKTYNYKIVKL